MTAMEVYFVTVHCSGMVVSAGGLWTESFRLTPTYQIVQVKNVKIVESFLAVPTTENVKEVAYFVAGMSSSAAGWIVLWKWSIPSH
jgi:hypothetical protein